MIIGVYEPLVILVAGEEPRRTSLAAETNLPPDAPVLHEGCFALRRHRPPSGTQRLLGLDG